MSESESWRPVHDEVFKLHYEVSDRGRVRKPGKDCLLPQIMDSGLFAVNLSAVVGGVPVRKRCYVHRLMMQAFLVPKLVGTTAKAKDGNKLNLNLSNWEFAKHTSLTLGADYSNQS